MRRTFYFFSLTLLLLFSQTGFTQTLHNVQVANFSFTPSQLTINVGDTVRWTNTLGLHNVVADDGSFTSGPPSTSNWVYDHVFNSPGSNPYYCSVHGGPGGVGMSGVITVQTATDVRDNGNASYKFNLQQNYPNPFNPTTLIRYDIPQMGSVKLIVYDIIGNEVKTLVNEVKPAGNYEVTFNASEFSSGIYFYKLTSGAFVQTKKMTLLK